MKTAFFETLVQCAREDQRVFLLTADYGHPFVEEFEREFPGRFLNTGIQEQNAVSVATGLALCGRIVYFVTIIPFATMRCYEQIRMGAAYHNVPVRIVGVGAGLGYGPAGFSHHGLEDLSLMRGLPNMTVLSPGDPQEVRALMRESLSLPGPAYLRLGRGGEPAVHPQIPPLKIGLIHELSAGTDLQILATSNMLESGSRLVEILRLDGVSAGLSSCPTLKPFDGEYLSGLLRKGTPLVTLEEHLVSGGLGSCVAEQIAESGVSVRFKRFGLSGELPSAMGSQKFLRLGYGLDLPALRAGILELIRR